MTNFWKIAGYIVTALSLFIAGWQLSDWYKGTIVHVKEITKTDTLFITKSLPKEITKTIYVDKIERVRDTVFKEITREKYVEIIKYDTITVDRQRGFITVQKRNFLDDNDFIDSLIQIPYRNIFYDKNETDRVESKNEWWQDVIYYGVAAGVTYGLTRIK